MNNPLDMFRNMMSLGPNPVQVKKALFNKYPNLQVLSNQFEQSGLSPVDFVMQYAKQNNIPIQQNVVVGMYQQMRGLIK